MRSIPKGLYFAGMLLGAGGGSFCGMILKIEAFAILGLILFLYCWIRLAIGSGE